MADSIIRRCNGVVLQIGGKKLHKDEDFHIEIKDVEQIRYVAYCSAVFQLDISCLYCHTSST